VGVRCVITLLAFFYTSSYLTKYKSSVKVLREADHKEGGQRNWAQVLANGGVPSFLCMLYLLLHGPGELPLSTDHHLESVIMAMFVAALATSNGDTWASELGILSDGPVYLVTTCKKVPRGTNGGVSLTGTAASIAGGLFIGIVFFLVTVVWYHNPVMSQMHILLLGTLSGFFGSLIDSLFGALFEYSGYNEQDNKVYSKPNSQLKHISGVRLLDGNMTNSLSILLTSVVAGVLAYHGWIY